MAEAEERRARAIDRDNTARVRWGLEFPTLTDDELIAAAHDAAANSELAKLEMIRREAQQERRKTRDGVALLSGKLQFAVADAIKAAPMPYDESELARIDDTLKAAAARIDRARAVVTAPAGTEQSRDAHVLFMGTELLHALEQWKAAHPDADVAAIRQHEHELRFVRGADHKARVDRDVQRFVAALPSGLNVTQPPTPITPTSDATATPPDATA